MKKINSFEITKKILTWVLFLISMFSSFFILTFSYDYNLDSFCNNLTDFYNHDYTNFESPLFCIENKEDNSLDNLQEQFKSIEYNNFVNEYRFISNDCLSIDVLENKFETYFISQPTFYMTPFKDRFKLDYGRYYLYYDTNNRPVNFAFISESFAKKMMNVFSLKNMNELLGLKINIPSTSDTLVITNIIYSDGQYSKTINKLYGDFIMVNKSTIRNYDFHLEIGMKLNTYGNKELLKSLYKFDDGGFVYYFKKFDYTTHQYAFDQKSTMKFIDVQRIQKNEFISYLPLIIMIIFCILKFIFCRNVNCHLFLLDLILFAFYGIIANFVYLYPYFTILILISLLFTYFLERGYVNVFFHEIYQKLYFHIFISKTKI